MEGFRDGDAGKDCVSSDHFTTFVAETPSLLASTPLIISQTIDVDG